MAKVPHELVKLAKLSLCLWYRDSDEIFFEASNENVNNMFEKRKRDDWQNILEASHEETITNSLMSSYSVTQTSEKEKKKKLKNFCFPSLLLSGFSHIHSLRDYTYIFFSFIFDLAEQTLTNIFSTVFFSSTFSVKQF